MLGTIVNFVAVLFGGTLGLLMKGGIKPKVQESIMQGLGLCVIVIGVQGAVASSNTMLLIISIALGALLGEWWDLDTRLEHFSHWLEQKMQTRQSETGRFAKGFMTSSLLFCVGAMSIVGSLESGLQNTHTILFAKSLLDGISSIVFAASFGVGVLFSAATILLYQGAITLAAQFLAPYLGAVLMEQLAAVGSILILALGLNLVQATKFKVANLLPSLLVVLVWGFFMM
ncbi:MAG: DUF554 domain-containing protein [Erysipelotrichaceae bacterium]